MKKLSTIKYILFVLLILVIIMTLFKTNSIENLDDMSQQLEEEARASLEVRNARTEYANAKKAARERAKTSTTTTTKPPTTTPKATQKDFLSDNSFVKQLKGMDATCNTYKNSTTCGNDKKNFCKWYNEKCIFSPPVAKLK